MVTILVSPREWLAAQIPPPPGEAVDLPDLVNVDSDDDTTAPPNAVKDLKPSTLVLDRGPLLLRGATRPLICDSGSFLRVDTGAQLDLHAPTMPPALAAESK